MKYRRTIAAVMLLGAASFSALHAQEEKKEPPQRDVKVVPAQTPEEQKAPLPKIENPEFVITGHETMELPEAAKGDAGDAGSFVPPLPTAGAKQSDLSRTAQKQSAQALAQSGMNGKVDGSFGNFVTPALGAWFGKTFGQGSLAVNGRYSSTDGYIANTQKLSAGFGVAGSYKLDKSAGFFSESGLKSEFALGSETYRAYASSHPTQVRTHNDLDLGLGVDSRYAWAYPSLAPIDYTVRAVWNRTSLSDTASAVENEFGISAAASSLYDSVPVNLSLDYRVSSESMPAPGVETMHWLEASAGAKIAALENLQFSLGAAFYMYRGNVGPLSARLYPQLGGRWFAAPWITLHAAFEPGVTRATFRTLTRVNPYVLTASALMPGDAPARFTAGVDVLPAERAAVSVNFDYKSVNHYQSFIETPESHVWQPVYISDIRVMKTDIKGRYSLTHADLATAFVTFNLVTHKDSSAMLPYVPKVQAGVIYRHWFQSDISAEISAEYAGRRYTDFSALQSNAGYVLMNLKAEYGIARNLRLTAEAQNLLNQNYYLWNGYRERPLFVSFGINYLW